MREVPIVHVGTALLLFSFFDSKVSDIIEHILIRSLQILCVSEILAISHSF